ncbi:MAG: NAD(P)-dependent alcohol dehydrogenase [Halioglobus sp.]|nr:NAD(P)-dependent alcohol dehydrogenase [Halioglobus sp.]
MKAIVFRQYGRLEELELRQVPRPQPAEDDVLVRVRASSVNSWDWEYFNGTPFINRLMFGLRRPRQGKQRLGADIAGVVEAVGSRVTLFKPGDEVFGDLWDRWGGFAEYACTAQFGLQKKPEGVSFEAAACVPQAGVLALQGLLRGGQVAAGQRVLVNGAGGGVGSFAIQLARLHGAEVTAVDAAHKLDLARTLGAEHLIDYRVEDFTSTGQTWDLILDCQNFRSYFANRRALAPGGTYAMIGGSIPRVYQLWMLNLLAPLAHDGRKLCLVAEGPNKGLADLARLLDSGELAPVIDRTFPLCDVPEALRYFGEGRHRGKIAVTVPG